MNKPGPIEFEPLEPLTMWYNAPVQPGGWIANQPSGDGVEWCGWKTKRGLPMASEEFTVEEQQKMGLVGIYRA